MSNPRSTPKSARSAAPLVAVLEQLVVPAFEDEVDPAADEPSFKLVVPEPDSADAPQIHGRLCGPHLVHLGATPLDVERSRKVLRASEGQLVSPLEGYSTFTEGNRWGRFSPHHSWKWWTFTRSSSFRSAMKERSRAGAQPRGEDDVVAELRTAQAPVHLRIRPQGDALGWYGARRWRWGDGDGKS